MNTLVILFPPRNSTRADFDSAVHRHADSAEFIDLPPITPSEQIEDAEQLPLWRWFICS